MANNLQHQMKDLPYFDGNNFHEKLYIYILLRRIDIETMRFLYEVVLNYWPPFAILTAWPFN